MVVISQKCTACAWKRSWNSQPLIRDIPTGNLALSSAVLFAGASPTKALRIFSHMRLHAISERTFYRHQEFLLQPSILRVWQRHQQELLTELSEKGSHLVLGGDGRADSPGHTAKFGSYTMMELKTKKILEIQLVQVSFKFSCRLQGYSKLESVAVYKFLTSHSAVCSFYILNLMTVSKYATNPPLSVRKFQNNKTQCQVVILEGKF